MQNTEWCKNSIFCDDIKINTYFNTDPIFYFGDPNFENHVESGDFKKYFDLPKLSFNAEENQWSSLESLAGHEKEMGRYYRALIEKAKLSSRDFNSIRQHFWMRSTLASPSQQIGVSFPWYDSSSEFSSIYKWIMTGTEGEHYLDVEQGWILNGIILNGKIYLLETDDSNFNEPHLSEIYSNISFDQARAQSTIAKNIAEVQNTISKLTDEIGVDVWTKYIYANKVNFGTAEWRP